MKNKKLILFLIILFPSVFWLILELSTINAKKLPHYGPKSGAGKDTVFYQINPTFNDLIIGNDKQWKMQKLTLDTVQYPIFAVCFIKQSYQKDNYRMDGLTEYVQYKRSKIKEIPFIIVTTCDGPNNDSCFKEFEKFEKDSPNISNLFWQSSSFDSLNLAYFKEKPIYIDYSFFVLVDVKRQIRGYYDGRYVSEIKRLIEEYQHLRLKEEKKTLLNANKIETK